MEYACNEEKGLLAVSLDGTPETTWKFARCKYDGRLGCYKPDSALPISDYCVFLTRRLATEKAKSLCFPANRVEKLGNKFGVGWGIRHDIRDNYFLAVFD